MTRSRRDLGSFERRLRRLFEAMNGDVACLLRESDGLSSSHEDGDFSDDASQTHNEEITLALLEHSSATRREIEAALERLADGVYGDCAECGRAIPNQRLRAIPYTRYCVHCSSRLRNLGA